MVPITVGIRNRSSLLWLYAVTGLCFDVLVSLILPNDFYKSIGAILFLVVEFIIISAYYHRRLFSAYKTAHSYTVVALILLFLTYAIAKTNFTDLSTCINISGSIVFFLVYIIYVIIGLYTIIRQQNIMFLEKSSFFWATVAILIYASGMFVLILLFDVLDVKFHELLGQLWTPITCTINIIEYLILSLALSSKNP